MSKSPKNITLAIILGFVFGPFGLIYVSMLGFIMDFCLSVVLVFSSFGLGFLVIPFVSAIWGELQLKAIIKKLK